MRSLAKIQNTHFNNCSTYFLNSHHQVWTFVTVEDICPPLMLRAWVISRNLVCAWIVHVKLEFFFNFISTSTSASTGWLIEEFEDLRTPWRIKNILYLNRCDIFRVLLGNLNYQYLYNWKMCFVFTRIERVNTQKRKIFSQYWWI